LIGHFFGQQGRSKDHDTHKEQNNQEARFKQLRQEVANRDVTQSWPILRTAAAFAASILISVLAKM